MPVCHHEDADLVGDQPNRAGKIWTIVACRTCDTLYPRPRLDQDSSLGQVNPAGKPEAGPNPREVFGIMDWTWRLKRMVKPVAWPLDVRHFLKPFIKKGGRALDIGAADGRFCHLLETLGYHATGIDPREGDVARARSFGLDIRMGFFPDGMPEDLESERFDLISSMEALYYCVDLRESLARIHSLLKPGGHVLIKALNPQSLYFEENPEPLALRFGDNVHAMPTPKALRYWLRNSGFEILAETGNAAYSIRKGTKRSPFQAIRGRFGGMTLFGYPLYDFNKVESLLILGQKQP